MPSTFDIRVDAPSVLRLESVNITLTFSRTGPNTGRVSWNIPAPAAGCNADTQAYCGMLITLDTTPTDKSKLPTNGTIYESDPTGDTNVFAGDKIGTSLVIGAFYQDRTTTFFDITGLMPNTAYYVSGFPADCETRYYVQGVFAYSLSYAVDKTLSTASAQAVIISPKNSSQTQIPFIAPAVPPEILPTVNTFGAKPTDYTGLTVNVDYQFTLTLGTGDAVSQPKVPLPPSACVTLPTVTMVTVNGSNAQTFADLVNEINKQIAIITASSSGGFVSPYAPNTGAYYWDAVNKKLYQWDGTQNVQLDVYVQGTAPNDPVASPYWYDPTTNVIKHWNGSAWITQIASTVPLLSYIFYPTDPTMPICDSSIWFDGVNAHLWNGVSWCDNKLYFQATDPSLPVEPLCGSFWFDTATNVMYKWDDKLDMWVVISPFLKLNTDPNALPVGYYWFDSTTNLLYQRDTPLPGWNVQSNVHITETAPSTPAIGTFWYNPVTTVLQQWDGAMWVVLPNTVTYPSDPTLRHSCEVWWNTTTNLIYVWDDVHSVWNLAPAFFIQSVDPTLPPTLNEGDLWLNSTTFLMYIRQNGCWIQIPYINFPTDPRTTIPANTVWFDGTKWYNRSCSGYQFVNVGGNKTNASLTNLLPATPYTATITIDGIHVQPISVLGSAVTTFGDLVAAITTQLGGFATAVMSGGNIKVTSATFGPTSTVLIVNTGVDFLFAAPLNGFVSFGIPVVGTCAWVQIFPTYSTIDPTTIPNGTYWFNTSNNTLNQWNGAVWINLLYQTTSPAPPEGTIWFDTTNNTLYMWDGTKWILATSLATVELNCHGDLLFTSGTVGSTSFIAVSGTLFLTVNGTPSWTPAGVIGSLWVSLDWQVQFADPQPGGDGVTGTPSYDQLGIGTDGSPAARYELMNEIRLQLGYPTIDVELTEQQLDFFITRALQELRGRTAVAYSAGFFFMNIHSEVQRYILSGVPQGYDKIVSILGIWRLTSAFLSSAHGAGVYGQIVLQHLYNMGTFDLLSYHIIANYIDNMEILFAARVTYSWNEQTRELWIHHRFPFAERMVLIEASVERTEQELLTDRWIRPWIRRYATALARITLSETRGKWASLPGAGGNVTLNASDLRQAGKDEIDACIKEIEDFVVDRPEIFGAGTTFLMD